MDQRVSLFCLGSRRATHAGFVLAGLLLLELSLGASPASAWTEANVQSARGTVVVDRDGSAQVTLLLQVRIHRGWLEGLDIVGLDEDLELDEDKPVWATSLDEPSRKFQPRVRMRRGGRVSLSFRGRGASPRRGLLTVGLHYRTRSVEVTPGDDGRLEIRWTLPPWQSGLDGVVLSMQLPSGDAEALTEPGAEDTVIARTVQGASSTTVVWERPHLPRTVAWTVGMEAPQQDFLEGLHQVYVARPSKPAFGSGPVVASRRVAGIVALALWLWCGLVGWSFDRATRRAGASPRRLLPLPGLLSSLFSLVSLAFGALVWERFPAISLGAFALGVALSLRSTPQRLPARRGDHRWLPVERGLLKSAAWRRRLGWLGLGLPFDASGLVGQIAVTGVAAGLFFFAGVGSSGDPLLTASLLFLAMPSLTATRFHRPSDPLERLGRLRDAASAAQRSRLSLALEVLVDDRGELIEARLRLGGEREGEVRVAEHRGSGGTVRELQLWETGRCILESTAATTAYLAGGPSCARRATSPATASGSAA